MTDKAPLNHMAVFALSVVLLAGCAERGSSPDDRIGNLLISPGKYEFYTCAQLTVAGQALAVREKELTGLMARARTGAAGGLVSSIAYQPEYYQVHGDMNELRRAAAARKCDLATGTERPAAPENRRVAR
jgi:hypothetical protein